MDPLLPNVLVVDDLEANLKLMKTLLRGPECNLVFAKSGREALEQLVMREFAVLLLDVEMPGMDGYEVAQRSRANPETAEVPIIFVTGTQETDERMLRGYGSGAVDFLFKPINAKVLRSKVDVFLELHNGRKHLLRTSDALQRVADAHASLTERFRLQERELEAAYETLRSVRAELGALGKS
jgi:CheY-like chemotaxis protein